MDILDSAASACGSVSDLDPLFEKKESAGVNTPDI
jgi:hypothetical protein